MSCNCILHIFPGGTGHEIGTCSSESKCGSLEEIDERPSTSGLALQPIQSDLLSLNIRPAGGPDYNIHELPSPDGKLAKYIFCKLLSSLSLSAYPYSIKITYSFITKCISYIMLFNNVVSKSSISINLEAKLDATKSFSR